MNTTSESKNLFRQFVDEMNVVLRDDTDGRTKTQKQLLNDLFRLERKFKAILMSDKYSGRELYEDFMCYIMHIKKKDFVEARSKGVSRADLDSDGNMLSSRVYFRERQSTFSSHLFKAFHMMRPNMLHKFQINYSFVHWAIRAYKGPYRRQLNQIKRQMEDIRIILCENNLPLAINKAKVFWSRVPESNLEYMDLIQTANEGLLTAIDKFSPPYKSVFCSVAQGRMTLNMTTDYSATMVKLPPKERRILYRINKAKRASSDVSKEDVLAFVRESFPDVSADDVARIEAAAATAASFDSKKDDADVPLGEKIADTSASAEDRVMNLELRNMLSSSMDRLVFIENKVIRLKHGEF